MVKKLFKTSFCVLLGCLLLSPSYGKSTVHADEGTPTDAAILGTEEKEKPAFAKGKTGVIKDPTTGNWYYVVDGAITAGPTVQKNSSGWWYIDESGKVDFHYTGVASNSYGTWYCKNGQVDFRTNGVIKDYHDGNWYYLVNSKVTGGPTVQKNYYGWWYIDKSGKVDFNYNGVAKNSYGWWKIVNGQVDFHYNGVGTNEYGTWFCQNGKVGFNLNGVVKDSHTGSWYYVKGSKVTAGPTVQKNSNGWWYIDKTGKVDFSYTGLASNSNGTWYCQKGQVTFKYTGMITENGKSYDIVNSKVSTGPVLRKENGAWKTYQNGRPILNYTGLATSKYGVWYVKNGLVQFNTTDVIKVPGSDKWANIKGGKLTAGPDVRKNSNGWWYIGSDGYVDFSYNGVATNENGYWNITNGKMTSRAPGDAECVAMERKAQDYSSATGYLLLVNRSTHHVGIYEGSYGHWSTLKYWACADGKESTPTIEGTFTIQSKLYYFDSEDVRCFYASQFSGNYLFHSTLYRPDPDPQVCWDNRTGQGLSHGCVRLELANAKWIYDNIPRGSKVVVYH